MHPILQLGEGRHPEYHRGLAHGLQLALDQLRLLHRGHTSLITLSCIKAVSRRLQAVADAIRSRAWTKADAFLSHTLAPPIPPTQRPTHLPVLGRAAINDEPPTDHVPRAPAIHPSHPHRRSP